MEKKYVIKIHTNNLSYGECKSHSFCWFRRLVLRVFFFVLISGLHMNVFAFHVKGKKREKDPTDQNRWFTYRDAMTFNTIITINTLFSILLYRQCKCLFVFFEKEKIPWHTKNSASFYFHILSVNEFFENMEWLTFKSTLHVIFLEFHWINMTACLIFYCITFEIFMIFMIFRHQMEWKLKTAFFRFIDNKWE